jgi:hypothetical protein
LLDLLDTLLRRGDTGWRRFACRDTRPGWFSFAPGDLLGFFLFFAFWATGRRALRYLLRAPDYRIRCWRSPGHLFEAFDSGTVDGLRQSPGDLAGEGCRVAGERRAIQPGFDAHQAADVPDEEAGDGTAHFRGDPQGAAALLLYDTPQEGFECCPCVLTRGTVSLPWLTLNGRRYAANRTFRRSPLHSLLCCAISGLLEMVSRLAHRSLQLCGPALLDHMRELVSDDRPPGW